MRTLLERHPSLPNHSAETVPAHTPSLPSLPSTRFGRTWVDFPNHNLILVGINAKANTLQHVKIFGWRTNSDGVHLWGNWNEISDLFLRTQGISLSVERAHPSCRFLGCCRHGPPCEARHCYDTVFGTLLADDSMYVGDNNGVVNWKRITAWNDANGVPFLLAAGGKPGAVAVLDDSDVLFHRKEYYAWCGGVINARWSATVQSVTSEFTTRSKRARSSPS